MNHRAVFGLASMTLVACFAACSSNSATPAPAGPTQDSGPSSPPQGSDASTDSPANGATTTIAQARGGNVKTPITVQAVVTAIQGDPATAKTWYVEDPAGGPSSGVSVYCNKAAKTNPCPAAVATPALHDLVLITGTIASYKGRLEIVPTSMTTISANAALPPIPVVQMSDVAPGGSSNLRGVLVKLATKVTVDDVTPTKLYDTKCATADGGAPAGDMTWSTWSSADGGVDSGAAQDASAGDDGGDAGATEDAGLLMCSGCKPPTYSGFSSGDGAGNEVLIEGTFYTTEHLASSPECISQQGAVAVTVGKTFSSVTGILDLDVYGNVQALSPVQDSDYVTP